MIAWTEHQGNWKAKLRFEFCRIQFKFPLLPDWMGFSVFLPQRIGKVDGIKATLWNLPFNPVFVEVKYHYSHDMASFINKLVSFSVRRDSLEKNGYNDLVKDLDGRIVAFTKCRSNGQRLGPFEGEVYPDQISVSR